MLSSASNKAKFFANNFSKKSDLDDLGIFLPISPSRTNLKLHNISVTPKMVRKVLMNLHSSKTPGLDCILVVVRKIYEPELSYIQAELCNKCRKDSLVVYVFKLKTTALLVFFLWLVKSL